MTKDKIIREHLYNRILMTIQIFGTFGITLYINSCNHTATNNLIEERNNSTKSLINKNHIQYINDIHKLSTKFDSVNICNE